MSEHYNYNKALCNKIRNEITKLSTKQQQAMKWTELLANFPDVHEQNVRIERAWFQYNPKPLHQWKIPTCDCDSKSEDEGEGVQRVCKLCEYKYEEPSSNCMPCF